MRFLIVAIVAIACGVPNGDSGAGAASPSPVPRCADGRPQNEIDHAGALPFAITSDQIVCVSTAISEPPSHDRAFRLSDGRMLHVYERTAPLPSKPTAAPLASGRINVAKATWSWFVLDQPKPVLMLQTDRSDIYIELDLPVMEQNADLRLLESIAGTVSLP